MKRKVIQLAGKTHVVSLPSKWVRSFNVKKGDFLNLEEAGNNIIIKPEKSIAETKSISLHIDNFDELTLKYTMSALHKLGYDEITLFFEEKKFHDVIQHLIKNLLLGFVIIDQTSKKVVLKSVANEIDTELNSTLRRAFLVTNSLAQSTLEAIESNNFHELSSMTNLENTNNQLTSFCLRLINKGFYKDQEKKAFLIIVIWNLEKIADEYKAICINLVNNKEQINVDIINLYKEVNGFFNGYYDLNYSFSVEKINNLVKTRNSILKLFQEIKPNTNEETILLNRLSTIVSKTADISSSILALNYEKLN